MGLTEFLANNKRDIETFEYVVSEKIKDENGEPAKWKIRTVAESEDKNLRRLCTKKIKDKRGNIVGQDFDQAEYLERLVAKCVVDPDLNNANLQDAYGVKTDYDLIGTMLTAGDFANLLNYVQEINNYSSLDDKIDEAKN